MKPETLSLVYFFLIKCETKMYIYNVGPFSRRQVYRLIVALKVGPLSSFLNFLNF